MSCPSTLIGSAARAAARQGDPESLGVPPTYEWRKPERPLTAIVIGAGGRGRTYASYAPGHRDEWRIVGVAEPIEHRNRAIVEALPDLHFRLRGDGVFLDGETEDYLMTLLGLEPANITGQVREDVLGAADRAPSDEELSEMEAIVARAMEEGAYGMSSGLAYAPGMDKMDFFRRMRAIVQTFTLDRPQP